MMNYGGLFPFSSPLPLFSPPLFVRVSEFVSTTFSADTPPHLRLQPGEDADFAKHLVSSQRTGELERLGKISQVHVTVVQLSLVMLLLVSSVAAFIVGQ
jgi:hypothetical protein